MADVTPSSPPPDNAPHAESPDDAHRHPSHLIFLAAMVMSMLPPNLPTTSAQWAKSTLAGTVWDPALGEMSGLAFSATTPEVMWTHNDSGDAPRLFLLTRDGATHASVALAAIDAYDVEDIDVGPCTPRIPGDKAEPSSCIFVADVGDNRHVRTHVHVYVFKEPPDLLKEPPEALTPTHIMHLRHPDGAHDVEALMVHPMTGEAFLVEKSRSGATHLLSVPRAAWHAEQAVELEKIGEVPLEHDARGGTLVTAGDFSPDGRCVALRTYLDVHTWCAAQGTSPDDVTARMLRDTGDVMMPPGMLQSEAITFDPRDGSLWLTSERWPAPLVRVAPASDSSSHDDGDLGTMNSDAPPPPPAKGSHP